MGRRECLLLSAAALVVGLATTACRNPVSDEAIEALGPELPNVPESEFHRPGQPCVLCHDEYFGAEPRISIGGTVFASRDDKIPVGGATITIIDGRGETRTATTNCVGNFFFNASDYEPAFPLNVQVQCPGSQPTVMNSIVNRDGSCAGCHIGAENETSPGWVRCGISMPDPPIVADPNCPGVVPQ